MSPKAVARDTLLTTLREQFEAAWIVSQPWRTEAEEDCRFVAGDQWDAKDRANLQAKNRPVLVFNEVLPQVDLVSGMARQTPVGYRAYPRGGEDQVVSTIATACLAYAMERTQGAQALYRGYDDGVITGRAWWEIGLDTTYTADLLGEVYLGRVRPMAIVEDPGAERLDRQDAEFIAKAAWAHEAAAKRRWPEHRDAFNIGDWLTGVGPSPIEGWSTDKQQIYLDAKTKQVRLLYVWYKVPKTRYVVTDGALGHTTESETGREAEAFLRTARRAHTTELGPFEDRYKTVEIKSHSLRVATMTGWRILDDQPHPIAGARLFPFVPMLAHNYTDEPFGLVRNIKDPQREINKRRSTFLHIMMTSANSGWKVHAGSMSKAKIRSLEEHGADSGLVLVHTGNFPPQEIIAKTMPNAYMEYDAIMSNSIRKTTSINAELAGQTTQQTVSGAAITARQRGGLVGLQGFVDAFAFARTQIGMHLLQWIQHYYDEQKIRNVLGDLLAQGQAEELPGGAAEIQQVLANEKAIETFKRMRQTELDVVLMPDATPPTIRATQFADLMQLRQAGFPIPPEIILDASDAPKKDAIRRALKAQGVGPPLPTAGQATPAAQSPFGGGG